MDVSGRNLPGGTRVPRVVSGVTPETVCGHSLPPLIHIICIVRLPTQFGGTPN
jgi:hypothetical protein